MCETRTHADGIFRVWVNFMPPIRKPCNNKTTNYFSYVINGLSVR